MARRLRLIPICLGTHEPGNASCDGDPAQTGKARQPCSWRGRCLAFRAHLDQTGEDEEKYIEIVKTTPAVRKATGWQRTAKPVGGTFEDFCAFVQGLDSGKKIKKKKPQQRYLRDPNRQQSMKLLLRGFLKNIRRNVPRDMAVSSRRLILPGMLYIVNRKKTSGYMSLYCRERNGAHARDRAVAIIYPKIKSVTVSVGLAVDIRAIQHVCTHQEFDDLGPRPHSDGSFHVMCPRLREAQLELLSKVIGRLIETAALALPDST